MDQKMLGVPLRNRVENKTVHQKTKVEDIVTVSRESIIIWAEYMPAFPTAGGHHSLTSGIQEKEKITWMASKEKICEKSRKSRMVHVTPFQIFKEVDINSMADMELRAFEARLDTMVDQLGEESTELIIERPRYAHAVMVFANSDEPGELLTASRIKVLDPIFVPVEATTNGHQVFHHYSEDTNGNVATESTSNLNDCGDGDHCDFVNGDVAAADEDDDIQKALRKLEESRNMLDEPIILSATNTPLSNESEMSSTGGGGGGTVPSKMPQFPSQLRKERRASASPGRT